MESGGKTGTPQTGGTPPADGGTTDPPANGGTTDPPANGGTPETPASIPQWALKTLGGIVTTLGLAGSMVVIGSAVLWARFKEAGMPAIQAISVQPSHEALVQGAQTTIVFALIAFAAVAVLYVVDSLATEGEHDKPHAIGAGMIVVIGLLAVGGIVWAVTTNMHFWSVIALGVVVLALATGCVLLGLAPKKNFWALAAAAFVATIIFAGAAEYLIVKDQKFVQAVAALRDGDDEGVNGFYVAIDGDTLYFANSNLSVEHQPGRVEPKHKPIEKTTLGVGSTYAIGPLESPEDAALRAESMLERLRTDRKQDPTGITEKAATVTTEQKEAPETVEGAGAGAGTAAGDQGSTKGE